MTQNEYIALVEEHGLGNLILTESYMHNNVKVEIVFDDKIIEYHKLINGLTKPWAHDAIEAKKQFDVSHSKFFEVLDRGMVPVKFNENPCNRKLRNKATQKYNMWAIVDMDWTENLANELDGHKCLEIAAGKGWLSKALSNHGIDVISTDMYPNESYTKNSDFEFSDINVFNVKEMEAARAIEKYADDVNVLICSWPGSADTGGLLTLTIKQLKKSGHNNIAIVYVGESEGGCTDSEDLWDLVNVKKIISIPQWDGLRDSCYIMTIK